MNAHGGRGHSRGRSGVGSEKWAVGEQNNETPNSPPQPCFLSQPCWSQRCPNHFHMSFCNWLFVGEVEWRRLNLSRVEQSRVEMRRIQERQKTKNRSIAWRRGEGNRDRDTGAVGISTVVQWYSDAVHMCLGKVEKRRETIQPRLGRQSGTHSHL